MVGGGRGAFIGGVHRIAAAIDGEIELVCGAFSSTAEKSKASGEDLMLDPARCYGDFKEMIQKEKRRKASMLFPLLRLTICTMPPQKWHWRMAFM